MERFSGFELVELSLDGEDDVRTVGTLPPSTLLAVVSPDGERVAVTHDALEVHIAPLEFPSAWEGEPVVLGEVTGWSPQGELLLWDDTKARARLVHPDTGKLEELPVAAKHWAFAPDGGAVVVADGTLTYYVSYWRDVYDLAPVEDAAHLLTPTIDGQVVLRHVERPRHHDLVTLEE